jgi:hypothetical protein
MIRNMIGAAAMAATTVSAAEAVQPPAPIAVQPPAAPEAPVDPARLAAAQRLMDVMWSDASFGDAMAGGLREGVADMARREPAAAARDPHHAERMRLTMEAMEAEYRRVLAWMGPEVRALGARFYARNMSLAELEEAVRFYATPAGQRFAAGSWAVFGDPAAPSAFPVPNDPALDAAFARIGNRITAATAHLSRRASSGSGGAANSDAPTVPGFAVAPVAPPPSPPPPRAAPPSPPLPPVRPPETVAAPRGPIPIMPPARPTLPPVDPARLAAARSAVALIFPDEAFRQPLPLPRLLETVLGIPLSTFGDWVPGPSRDGTVGDFLSRYDPNFREGSTITARILSEELPGALPLLAPHFRTGAAELYARRFSIADLTEISRFFATPAGRAVARNSFSPLVDPELVRGLILMAPRVIAETSGAMARIRQATAHLPPPPPETTAPSPGEDQDEHGAHDDHDDRDD